MAGSRHHHNRLADPGRPRPMRVDPNAARGPVVTGQILHESADRIPQFQGWPDENCREDVESFAPAVGTALGAGLEPDRPFAPPWASQGARAG